LWDTMFSQRPDDSYYQSNPGHLILATSGDLPFQLKRALEPYLPVVLSDNVPGFRWNKIAINSVINGLGAVTGLTLGKIFNTSAGRKAAIMLVKETAQLMRTLGIHEGIVPGAISVYKFEKWPVLVQHIVLFILGRKYALIKTSMLQDIEKNLKTETDQIHGAIVRTAEKIGKQAPLTEFLMNRIHLIENKKARPLPGFCKEFIELR
jgi:2-dehydropantoate 2-reductase